MNKPSMMSPSILILKLSVVALEMVIVKIGKDKLK